MTNRLRVLVVGGLLCLAGAVSGEDWPQFMGPNRDGISKEKGLMTRWPAEGPTVLWTANVGKGFSAVAVQGDRVYTLGQIEETVGANEKGMYVLCFDASSGKVVWQQRTNGTYAGEGYPGARSTPTLDGDRLYVVDPLGHLMCLESATGKMVWEQADIFKQYGGANLQWGSAMSPLVDGDLLLINPGKSQGASIVALKKATGEVVWKSQDDVEGYSSPIIRTIGGQRQVVFFTGNGVLGLVPESGKLLWRAPWKTSFDCHAATPIVRDDLVFVTSGYNVGCGVVKVDLKNAESPATILKTSKVLRSHFGSPILLGEHVYGYDENELKCVKLETLEQTWGEKKFGKGSLVVAEDLAYVFGEKGNLALAKLSPEKIEIVSEFQTPLKGTRCWTMPVVANGRLYLRNEKDLVCLDVKGQ